MRCKHCGTSLPPIWTWERDPYHMTVLCRCPYCDQINQIGQSAALQKEK